MTSHRSDYKRLPQAMTKLKFARKNKQKPLNDEENLFHSGAYVAVIKKNPAAPRKADSRPKAAQERPRMSCQC